MSTVEITLVRYQHYHNSLQPVWRGKTGTNQVGFPLTTRYDGILSWLVQDNDSAWWNTTVRSQSLRALIVVSTDSHECDNPLIEWMHCSVMGCHVQSL